MRATAERPIRACLEPFSYRFAALCICVVTAGCTLVEGRGSPATGSGVILGDHDIVEVSRYREAAGKYHCSNGVLMCEGGGVTERCHCSMTVVVQLR